MSSLRRKIARKLHSDPAFKSKHMQAALAKVDMGSWTEERRKAFVFVMGELFDLKTDAERAKWILSYCESMYNYGQDSLRVKHQEEIQKYEAHIETLTKPKIELVPG